MTQHHILTLKVIYFRLIHVIAINEIDIFGTFSGLMINRSKTEGLWKLKRSKDKVEIVNGQINQ
jgi:hypothetical protein